jgi:hypothetical protein
MSALGYRSPARTPPSGPRRAPRQSHTTWLASLCVLFIGTWLGGCAIIDAEKNNRGGFLDEIADDLWMKADSKKMRALRAVALEASLARIAMIAPKSAADRALLARRIGETTKRADMVRQCAFLELQLAGQLSSEPCFFFDSVMVDYENALFDLALVALPLDDVKTLTSRVSGGIASVSINPLQLVQTLLDIGREAFRYGRVVGAIYRDTLELEVQVWLASPGFEGDARIAALSRIYARGNDDILAWRAAITALRADGLEPIPQQRFIRQLYGIIGYICGQIVTPNPADQAYIECARPDLSAKLPLVNLPGARPLVIGGIGPGGPGPGGTGSSSNALNQQLQSQARKLEELERLQRRQAMGQTEQNITGPALIAYKQAICVTGAHASADLYDAQTRERLREFVSGLEWATTITPNAVVIGPKLVESLNAAVKISPSCGVSNSVARNAYEAGIYARSGVQAVDAEMQNALKFLKRSDASVNDTLRGREAITALGRKMPQATNGAQIDPPLWQFITRNSHCSAVSQLPSTIPGGARVQSDCP